MSVCSIMGWDPCVTISPSLHGRLPCLVDHFGREITRYPSEYVIIRGEAILNAIRISSANSPSFGTVSRSRAVEPPLNDKRISLMFCP